MYWMSFKHETRRESDAESEHQKNVLQILGTGLRNIILYKEFGSCQATLQECHVIFHSMDNIPVISLDIFY